MQWVVLKRIIREMYAAPNPTVSWNCCPSKLLSMSRCNFYQVQLLNQTIIPHHVPQRQASILIWFSLERTWKRSEALIQSGVCLVRQRAVGRHSNAINTFCNLDKYILQFLQIHLAIWTNTFGNFDKYVLQFWQIHPAILTNKFWNWVILIKKDMNRLLKIPMFDVSNLIPEGS